MECRACSGQFRFKAPWSLNSVDPGSTCHLDLGKPSVAHTLSTPHTCQWHLFAAFLPPHNTTEQVSLMKWPPSPRYVGAEMRHWRDLQTEEAKINKEEGPSVEVTGEQIKTLELALTKHWRGLWTLRTRTSWNKDLSETELTPHRHNSSREIPTYIFTIVPFMTYYYLQKKTLF